MLEQGEVDIAPTNFAVTKERSAVVDYLPGLDESYEMLFLKNPYDALYLNAYTEPFTPLSWLGVVLLIVMSPPILAGIILYGELVPL